MRHLRVPVLVPLGDRGGATPRASAEAVRDAIPGARPDAIAGAARLPTLERPGAVAGSSLQILSPQAGLGAAIDAARHFGDTHD
jgi:pimeloyl-ACP methyl ester carboxylesterase